MKRIISRLFVLISIALIVLSCQKAPFITLNTPRSFTFTRDGGTQNISFTCNRDWSVSPSESWISVSPASGTASDGEVTVKITCKANTTYDPRSATVTIKVEELTEAVSISQDTGIGIIVSPTSYDLSSEGQTFSIKTQSNVQYTVEVETDAKSWISIVESKGLNESSINLMVSRNNGYDRRGRIIIRYENMETGVIIKQKGADVEFEDENFKAYCVTLFDKDGDNEVSYNEALDIEKIDCYRMNISSLGGVERFLNLKELRCDHNEISSLDLSNCKSLVKLRCSDNQLTNLDVSKCVNLEIVECVRNKLREFIFDGIETLQDVNCAINQLESITIIHCPSLKGFVCAENQLSFLALDGAPRLEFLWCSENNLSGLNISKNHALTQLACGNNTITSLDLSGCSKLEEISCEGNRLSTLRLSNCPVLKYVCCDNNYLNNLDISNCELLEELYCYGNQLASLDVSGYQALCAINCKNNKLTSLNVSNSPSLINLDCQNNLLVNLNVDNCNKLCIITCSHNRLSGLDVSSCTALEVMYCNNNPLTILDVSNNLILQVLYCNNCPQLKEIWLKTGQTIQYFEYDKDLATIKYKE